MQFILRTIAIFVAVGVAVWLVPGIDIVGTGSSWGPIAVMALIIALLNMTIKPFLQLIGLPITVLSLGVFYLVINTILLYVAASMGNALFGAGFVIDSFGSGFVASIVISIVSGFMNSNTSNGTFSVPFRPKSIPCPKTLDRTSAIWHNKSLPETQLRKGDHGKLTH